MPDVELKPQVYKDPRPKEFFDPFHARVRDHEPEPVYEFVRTVTLLWALIGFRARAFGTEKVPNGPVILAPNHASFMDEEAFASAFEILKRGGAVVMYCEGGRSRTGGLAETARPGIGRLALEAGVPVVPVAILGSYQVRNWKRLQFPKVTIQFGEPFRFERIEHPDREQQQAAADEIFGRIKTLHADLAALGHNGAKRAARERGRARRSRSLPPAPDRARRSRSRAS